MGKYLKFVGVIMAICFFIGLILVITVCFKAELGILGLLYVALVLFFGPALSLLFLKVGDLLNENNSKKQ